MPAVEIIAGTGAAAIFGDIGNVGLGPAITAGLRYRFNNSISVKASFYSAIAKGSDKNTRNQSRGLTYTSILLEPALNVEYFFFEEKRGFDRRGHLITRPRIRPYIFAGTGGVYLKPDVSGENLTNIPADHKKFTWMASGGIGFIYKYSLKWLWGIEIGGRYITIDYIDGFSPAASKANDLYYMAALNLIYRWESKPYQRRRYR